MSPRQSPQQNNGPKWPRAKSVGPGYRGAGVTLESLGKGAAGVRQQVPGRTHHLIRWFKTIRVIGQTVGKNA